MGGSTKKVAFFERLSKTKDRPDLGNRIGTLINNKDLLDILDFLTPSSTSSLTYEQEEVLNAIDNIPLNACLRIPKEFSSLKRTLNILHTKDGEYMLMLETKSKLADGSKRTDKTHMRSGTSKSGKPAWRIDDGEIEYFNLVSREDITEEALFSQKFNEFAENVTVYLLGAEYEDSRGKKMSIYSLKAEDTLYTLLSRPNKYFSPHKDEVLALLKNDDIKYDLIMQMLQAIKVFHDQGYVHQDVKDENYLVYYDPVLKQLRVKIADYGLTKTERSASRALATMWFESPEISAYYREESRGLLEYYHGKFSSYAKEIVIANKMEYRFDIFPPQKANDIWALGIIAFKLLHDRLPTYKDKAMIENHSLLSGLLRVEKSRRFTIDKAIENCSQITQVASITRQFKAMRLNAQ